LLLFSLRDRIEAASYDEARMPFSSDGGFDVMMLYRASGMKLRNADEAQALDRPAERHAGLVCVKYRQRSPRRQHRLRPGNSDRPSGAGACAARGRDASRRRSADGPAARSARQHPRRDRAALVADGEKAMNEKVAPARAGFIKFMTEEYVPHAAKSLAASDLPDGKRYYAFLARRHTTTDLTPDQIHDIGQAEVARIRARMQEAMKAAGFQGDLTAFIAMLRKDPRFYATSRQQLLEKSSEIAKRADDQLPGPLRRPAAFELRRARGASQYRARAIRPAAISAAIAKVGRAGGLMINTSELDQRPLYELPALVLHEGAPGHHIQTSLAAEQVGVPEFRRNLYFTAYRRGLGPLFGVAGRGDGDLPRSL
jgi:uncharacterized protein (DUF885 family)